MNYKSILLVLVVICLNVAFTFDTAASETDKSSTIQTGALSTIEGSVREKTMPSIVKIGESRYQVGNLEINKAEGSVIIHGQVNMSDGLVEYLACTPSGKVHESVLSLAAEPYHIQVALLLLGINPGDAPIKFQGAPDPPCGDPVNIRIFWEEKGKTVEFSPEDLVRNINTKTKMDKVDWVFTGSKILDGQYMAQMEGSIIAIYHDPFAIIDHRSILGADDTVLYANKDILPPAGTPVFVKINADTNLDAKKRVQCKHLDK